MGKDCDVTIANDNCGVHKDKSAEEVLPDFVKAVARHRHHEREMDPPEV